MMCKRAALAGAVGLCALVGCAGGTDARQGSINAAYARGEISFEQREQLTNQYQEQKRLQTDAAIRQLTQSNRSENNNGYGGPGQFLTPPPRNYEVYDTN